MNGKRFALASSLIFAFALGWGALVHMVILRRAEAAIAHLLRPDLAGRMWISLLATAALVCLFVVGYVRSARLGTVREGIGYGVFFALVAGVLVDVNQYVLYPVPGPLALAWFAAGVVEFAVYGALASALYPVSGRPR